MKALKSLAILGLLSLLCVGCEPNGGGSNSEEGLFLTVDNNTIYDNGEDVATFTVYYDGAKLQGGYVIYEGDNELTGNTFKSKKQGTYTFDALYGTLQSNKINVNVIQTPPPAPAVPEDTNPEKTNFVRRVLLTQFTGTGCGYCPYMINALHELENSSYAPNYVLAVAHLYNESDPAYLSEAQTLDNAYGVNNYPSITADLQRRKNVNPDYASLTSLLNTAINRCSVKAGIAVNAEYHPNEKYVVINTLVKAKTTDSFRVGAWLLEDGISGKQTIYDNVKPLEGVNFNIHDNAIRLANSKNSNTDFSGFALGSIEAGKTASKDFAFHLKDKWKVENLHLVVFVTTKEGDKWLVNNVINAPIQGVTDFEYED